MSRMDTIKALFLEALELPEERRASFLDEIAGDAPQVRAEVERLLRARSRAGKFLEFLPTEVPAPPQEERGRKIDRYELLEEIGEGGFGIVWRARQHDPVEREVALKILRAGMDTREVSARFAIERQTLARMDHPNITRILDGGRTEDGRPYFVMELVDGRPITQDCRARSAPLRERLELFVAVCDTVQHAHRRGIIHRDLKPTNILVVDEDGRRSPRIIDFGIAKLTEGVRDEENPLTEPGRSILGTPEYMSPEQIEGSQLVDTRTDVYSLGVLLHELLTGELPFVRRGQSPTDVHTLLRDIREREPAKPSTVVRKRLQEHVNSRGPDVRDVRKLASLLRGELDWIVLAALAKDREHRYPSVAELALDVRRHLAGEVVEARPPSRLYRLCKFTRRHAWLMTSLTVVFLSLVASALLVTLALLRAQEQTRLSEERRREAEAADRRTREALVRVEQQEHVARVEARKSKLALSWILEMLGASNLFSPRSRVQTIDQLLQRIDRSIDERIAEFPETEGELRLFLGRALRSRNALEASARHLDRALELAPDEFERARIQIERAMIAQALDRPDDAHAILDENLARLPGDTPLARDLLSLTHLVHAQFRLIEGELADARHHATRCLEWRERDHGETHVLVGEGLCLLGEIECADGALELAARHFERAFPMLADLEGARRHGAALVELRLRSMGHRWVSMGRPERALEAFESNIEIMSKIYGATHVNVARAEVDLGRLLTRLDRLDAAAAWLERGHANLRRSLGPDHLATLRAASFRASLERRLGRHEAAVPLFEEALDGLERLPVGRGDRTLAGTHLNLAITLEELGRFDEAEKAYRKSVAIFREAFPEGDLDLATALEHTAGFLKDRGRGDEALELAKDSLAMTHRLRGEDAPEARRRAAMVRSLTRD